MTKQPNAKRHTALLGGTFDPPHFGHIRPLLDVLKHWPLQDCWLLPNHIPPHKPGTHASPKARLQMIDALCREFPAFSLCDVELRRDEPSYTVNTLRQLRELYPDRVFYFVMGMDSFLSLDKWFEWQQLFELCHLVVCARPGYQLAADHGMAEVLANRQHTEADLPAEDSGKVLITDIREQDISSTDIRTALAERRDIRQLVPESVARVIETQGLYR